MKYLLIWLVIINIVAFALAGIDKRKAVKGKWRIRESTLFLSAILGGSVGLFVGMLFFRHKTKHLSFMIGVPAIFIAQVLIAVYVLPHFFK